jgi:uncharacterized protein
MDPRDASSVLVVFARRPTPGEVKTRLAVAIGAERAADLYAAFIRDLVVRLRDAPFAVRWSIAPPLADFASRFGIAPEECREQEGTDLGARMLGTFVAMQREGFSSCAIVGSDVPQLPLGRIEEGLTALDAADLVLGPAVDGGYYLVAMRAPHDVFTGVPWSSPVVLERTLERAAVLGLRVHLLEPDFDVDTAEDLDRLRELLRRPERRREMPATCRVLDERVRPEAT